MGIIAEVESYRDDLIRWRRDIHAHPELAYCERRTAAVVAERLRRWGIDVDQGLAETGVVGTLTRGSGPCIGLRADLDALPMEEANTFERLWCCIHTPSPEHQPCQCSLLLEVSPNCCKTLT